MKLDEIEEYKEPGLDLFKEVLPTLNMKTNHLLDADGIDKERQYKKLTYMVNRAFMQSEDTLLFANEMNKYHFLPAKLHYDFYFYGVEKKQRFKKWAKAEELNNNVELIQEYYDCSAKKAKELDKVLTKDQIKIIKQRLGKE